jgi:hypothetical protein
LLNHSHPYFPSSELSAVGGIKDAGLGRVGLWGMLDFCTHPSQILRPYPAGNF